MPAKVKKSAIWQADIIQSKEFYNNWFTQFAPEIFRETRRENVAQIREAFERSADLSRLTPEFLKEYPSTLSIFRTSTAPPIARDRLGALALLGRSPVTITERSGLLPPRMKEQNAQVVFSKMLAVISKLMDLDIFPWLQEERRPTEQERERAIMTIADRLADASAETLIREAHQQRQLDAIRTYLENRDYRYSQRIPIEPLHHMGPGTFDLRSDLVVGPWRRFSIPMDAVVQPHRPGPDKLPIFIHGKISVDYAIQQKRAKDELKSLRALRKLFGDVVTFVLFMTGYFDSGYLDHRASQGMHLVWEHRIDDLQEVGL